MLGLVLLTAGLTPRQDTDHDGLPDAIEQSLLVQFAPRFQVAPHDCAQAPARFTPGRRTPTPEATDGTIYGQVTPLRGDDPGTWVEIHYYDLWSTDCGAHGHALDDEHVAVLVQGLTPAGSAATVWQARYWYAAAHEGTVCDVSQIARASALDAVNRGAEVWISAGKHAAFFAPDRCQNGCGNDVCADSVPLTIPRLVNLGEPRHPMNGAVWAAAPGWALAAKMAASDFPASARQRAPASGVVLFNPGRHPAQGIIAISSHTADNLGTAQTDTAGAVGAAQSSTGNALDTSVHRTWNALRRAAGGVGHFLHLDGAGN